MRVVIPGGSGQVGTILAHHFHARGDEVIVLARTLFKAPWRVTRWDGRTQGDWARDVDGADVVINLAGRSVNCRYNPMNRREILESRVDSVRAVAEAIRAASRPPPVWLQASTATIYAHRLDAPNDEFTGIIGGDEAGAPDTWRFSIDVATAWEAALDAAVTPATRKVAMRSAMVMSADADGIFDTLLTLVRRGLGGNAAGGRQFVSWVHHVDFCRAIDMLIARRVIEGAVNIASPQPLPSADFMRELRQAAGVRIGLPATRGMLEIGAIFMRTETELILKSRRVVPARLLKEGFEFRFPAWPEAARELVAESIASRRRTSA